LNSSPSSVQGFPLEKSLGYILRAIVATATTTSIITTATATAVLD